MDNQEGLKRLNGLHKSYRQNMERYLILFKLCGDITKHEVVPSESLILRVYNGTFLWMLQINERVIELLRYKSGVEGSDSALCDMIHHAINSNEFNLDRQRTELTLNLQFSLGRGVHVKGALELGDALPVVDDSDFRLINQMFVFDLYDSLVNTVVAPVTQVGSKASVVQRQESPQPQQIFQSLDPRLNNKPVKPNTDMVRPNQKKRKGVGAKLA